MKRSLAAFVCFFGLSFIARASVSIEIDAGILRGAQTGTSTPAAVPVGGLLQLIATPAGATGTFGAPTANSFVSGDNIVIASFAMNYNVGTGITDNVISFTLANTGASSSTTFDAGDALLLRWYPTLTTSATAPGASTAYGQFRSDSGENGGIAWLTPADGATLRAPNGLNFFTSDVPTSVTTGTHAPATGYASMTVGVPEPSTTGLIGGLVVGMAALVKLRRRKIAA